jgi:hypothetical protein
MVWWVMAYRRLPYALRYLIALLAWSVLLAGTLLFKFVLLCMVPIILIWTKFGLDYTQQSAQATADLADMFIYKWPRFPRADWKRLFGLGSAGSPNRVAELVE